jgi:hypothetical protein
MTDLRAQEEKSRSRLARAYGRAAFAQGSQYDAAWQEVRDAEQAYRESIERRVLAEAVQA